MGKLLIILLIYVAYKLLRGGWVSVTLPGSAIGVTGWQRTVAFLKTVF